MYLQHAIPTHLLMEYGFPVCYTVRTASERATKGLMSSPPPSANFRYREPDEGGLFGRELPSLCYGYYAEVIFRHKGG